MSLQPWMIAAGWKPARFKGYRPAEWDPTLFLPVEGCEAIPGRRKTTSNFDRPKTDLGLEMNVDNFDTSDEARIPLGYDVRAGDALLDLLYGGWLKVAGEPTQKVAIPQLARQVAFVTTTSPPRIDDSMPWSAA